MGARDFTTFEFVDRQLRGKLVQKLIAWREEGLTLTQIADSIEKATGVKTSRETIRRWLRDRT